MADVVVEDLTHKLEDLDFDKDPHNIVGELVESLHKFD
jgi:hypothetical protein